MDCSIEELREWHADPHSSYIWHNDPMKYPYDVFAPFLYYLHCDLRKQITYERKTTKWYLHNANIVAKSQGNIKCSEGVKGAAPECKMLKFEIADSVNNDPSHVFKNVAENVWDLWTSNKKLYSDKVIRYSKLTHAHPFLFMKKEEIIGNLDVHNNRKNKEKTKSKITAGKLQKKQPTIGKLQKQPKKMKKTKEEKKEKISPLWIISPKARKIVIHPSILLIKLSYLILLLQLLCIFFRLKLVPTICTCQKVTVKTLMCIIFFQEKDFSKQPEDFQF